MSIQEMIRKNKEKKRLEKLPGNGIEYDFEYLAVQEYSPFRDRKICVLGSSVAYGACSQQTAVAEFFARRFRCDYVKEAVSGTTLVDNGPDSYVERLVKNVDIREEFALFICQLSTNDATKKLPLGEISASEELLSFNTATITGAIEYIIAYVKEKWHCPVVFFTGSHYESAEYAAMVARLKELQGKWDIGILNLYEDEMFNTISDEKRTLYMNDPIHPTKAGYRDWWCPEMERQLLAYLNRNS